MFTIDTESGFRDAVLISAAYGLGENVVQGSVTPDEVCRLQADAEAWATARSCKRPLAARNSNWSIRRWGQDGQERSGPTCRSTAVCH